MVQWALPGSHPVQGVAGLEGKPGERQVDRPVVAFLKHKNSINSVWHLRNVHFTRIILLQWRHSVDAFDENWLKILPALL